MGKFVREERQFHASWKLLSKWYAGLCKRADRRIVKFVTGQVDTVEPLDSRWIDDAAAPYVVAYRSHREEERADQAAERRAKLDGQSSGGQGRGGRGKKKPHNVQVFNLNYDILCAN